jgi:hypothetical protein
LDSSVILSPGVGSSPLRRGIASVRINTLGPISAAFVILSFLCAHDHAQGLGDGRNELRDIDPSADAPGWEARHASHGAPRMSEERERPTCCQSGGKEMGDGGPYWIYALW